MRRLLAILAIAFPLAFVAACEQPGDGAQAPGEPGDDVAGETWGDDTAGGGGTWGDDAAGGDDTAQDGATGDQAADDGTAGGDDAWGGG